MTRILVVEDNLDLAFGLRINLEQEGYEPVLVHGGRDAIEVLRGGDIDLVLLDLMLPDISGFDVLSAIRGSSLTLPVIVLSARDSEPDRVGAFRLGADDYVTKPFSLLELLERVNARLRSYACHMSPVRQLRIDLARRECKFGGVRISVTRLEFDLLVTLVQSRGRVLSKKELLESVWHLPPGWNTRTVDAHIFSLRRKLKQSGIQDAVRTVHGVGIAWTGDAEIFAPAAHLRRVR